MSRNAETSNLGEPSAKSIVFAGLLVIHGDFCDCRHTRRETVHAGERMTLSNGLSYGFGADSLRPRKKKRRNRTAVPQPRRSGVSSTRSPRRIGSSLGTAPRPHRL